MKKQIIFFFGMFLLSAHFFAQTGNHASDIDWKYIENENVRVIYPKNAKEKAQRIANIIYHINRYNTASVGNKSKKVDLILQTNQVLSNGFVTVAPFRSELFGTAPQNIASLGSTDWLDLLAIHEYRHVLQYANADRGFTKLLHILNGDHGWGSSISFKIPSWYLEGDAVLSETLLTENGRGRNPNFFKEQRALFLENIDHSYMKSRNGSYKDIVPNRYPLGYMMVNYLRNNFDFHTGAQVLRLSGETVSPFYTFSNALKSFTGLSSTDLYQRSKSDLKHKWEKEISQKTITESTLVSPNKKNTITHYTFPTIDKNNGVYCIKKSFKTTSEIVYIKNKTEKKITTIGYTPQEFLSYKNKKLLWTELGIDIRRGNKNFSNIVLYDLNKRSKKQITNKGKYFSPEISDDGTKILAVKSDENLKNNLVLISSKTGKEIGLIDNPSNDFISYPKWFSNDNQIIYIAKRNSKIAFFKHEISNNTTEQMSKWTAHTIGHFTIKNSTIYYTASYDGIDNIYSLSTTTPNNISQISSVKTGTFTPTIDYTNKNIIFSEFTSKGYELRKTKINPIQITKIVEPSNQEFYSVKTTNNESPISNDVVELNYKEEKYRGFFKGLKLHSWGIDFYESSINSQKYYIEVKNLLNDISARYSVLYNKNENTSENEGSLSFGKYFIIPTISFSKSNRKFNYINRIENINFISFTDNKLGFGINIPLKQIKGNYVRTFNYSSHIYRHIADTYFNNPNRENYFGSHTHSLTFSNFRRTALQNLAPKYGQYLQLNTNNSIEHNYAENYNLIASLFLPGFSENHSLSLSTYWNKQPATTEYRFADRFNYARGYKALFNKEGTTIRTNYQLPLFYPDWGFSNLIYFKRIRATVFYDKSSLKSFAINEAEELIDYNINQNSYGVEIIFDSTLLNNYGFTIGLRNSFLNNTDTVLNTEMYVPELIFSIGF